jgi:hypothetical protein
MDSQANFLLGTAGQQPTEITDHTGQPLPADRVFVAAPPDEIGPLLSAWSTVRKDQFIWPIWMRAFRCVLLALGLIAAMELAIAVAMLIGASESATLLARGVGLAMGTSMGLVAAFHTRWKEHCTYVGRDGIAEFMYSGGEVSGRILKFSEAFELRTREFRQPIHRMFLKTDFSCTWCTSGGRVLYKLSGYHHSRKAAAGESPRHYAAAAENAWTAHLMTRLLRELRDSDQIRFTIDSKVAIGIKPGALEIIVRGITETISSDQLATVALDNTVVRIRAKDARVLGTRGKYDFHYDQLPNAAALLKLIDGLVMTKADQGAVCKVA